MPKLTTYAAVTSLNEGMFFYTVIDTDSDGIYESRRVSMASLRDYLNSSVQADSATAVANILDTAVAYTSGGAKLLSVRNNGTEKFSVDKDGDILTASGRMDSGVADGASAVAWEMNSEALTTSGAKLLSLTNNNVEKFSVDKDGKVFYEGGELDSGVADGASAEAFVLNTEALTTAGAKAFVVKNDGTEVFSVDKDGVIDFAEVTHGGLYFTTPAATTLSAATPAKAAGTTAAAGATANNVTVSTSNRLTYTADPTKIVVITCNVSVTKAGGGATDGTFYLYKNGSPVTGAEVTRSLANSSDKASISLSIVESMTTNDYVELWVETNNGDNLTVESGMLEILAVG